MAYPFIASPDWVYELDGILSEGLVTTLFQPIVSLPEGRIHGYEAVSRGPSGSSLHNPLHLFQCAQQGGRLFELDLLCRRRALARYKELDLPGKLFVNISPQTLISPDYCPRKTEELLRRYEVPSGRVVIELTEQYPLKDYGLLRRALHHYREMGLHVALDDTGAGYSGLRTWLETKPEYVKIDRYFIRGIDHDEDKRRFVQAIADTARRMGCRVIGEGVENGGECNALAQMGIEYAQGYFFARPSEDPPRRLEPLRVAGKSPRLSLVECRLRDLPMETPRPLRADVRSGKVLDLFRKCPDLMILPVIDDEERLVGVVRRYGLMDRFSGQYGYVLYEKKPIELLMERNFCAIEETTPLDEVGKRVVEAMGERIDDAFIVTRQGRYVGLVRVVDLLRELNEQQVLHARHANPLTQLPGNVPIRNLIETCLDRRVAFTVVYADLDHFKPFNDVYGYDQGDRLLREVARIFQEEIEGDDFVGHIGGDDFILVLTSSGWRRRCQAVLDKFERVAPSFYSPEDRDRGGIRSVDRHGCERFFPFVSLSMGGVPVQPGQFSSYHEVADRASEAKRVAKTRQGNVLFIDRRQS